MCVNVFYVFCQSLIVKKKSWTVCFPGLGGDTPPHGELAESLM